MRHIFISYHHGDGDFAEVLINRIEKAGFETWVDNDRLRAGEDWRTEIDQAIKTALALIVIMTPEARSSEYVTYEWASAWGAGVKVIPILYKDTKLHPRLEALQYLNFTSRTARPWDALIEVIKNEAKVQVSNPSTSLTGVPSYLKHSIELLYSADPQERKHAIEILAQLDHPLALQALINALQHPLADVRIAAALVQGKLHELRAIPGLIEALRVTDKSVYSAAQENLIEIGDSSINELLEVLKDEDAEVRCRATEVLGNIGHPSALSGLMEALKDEDEQVRGKAAWALGKIRSPIAISALLETFNDVEDVWKETIWALGEIGDATTAPYLIELLHNEKLKWSLQGDIAKALGKLGEDAIPDLIEAMSDGDASVREGAAKALGIIGATTAVPFLIDALRDENWLVRGKAAEALGKIGDSRAVPALIEAVHNDDDEIFSLRDYGVVALGELKDSAAIPILLEALYDTSINVRSGAAWALGEIGSDAVPGLIKALHDEPPGIDNQIAEALFKIGEPAVPELGAILQSGEGVIKRKAINILRQIGTPQALATIKARHYKG
jgi:HEAT repeat protein